MSRLDAAAYLYTRTAGLWSNGNNNYASTGHLHAPALACPPTRSHPLDALPSRARRIQ